MLFASALFVFRQPELAGFAVFGTFAHQALVDYDTAAAARFAQSAMLTALGVIMVSLGCQGCGGCPAISAGRDLH
jgi:hypothetical protein